MKTQLERLNEVIDLVMHVKNYSVQRYVYEDLRYSPSFFCNVLKGNTPMSLKFVNRIKEVYPFVNINYILNDEGSPLLEIEGVDTGSQQESILITRRQNQEMIDSIRDLVEQNKALTASINALIKDNAELKEIIRQKL